MIAFAQEVFNETVTGTTSVYTSAALYEALAAGERFFIQVRTSMVASGTSMTIEIQHSFDGVSWATRSTPINAVSPSSSGVTVTFGQDLGTGQISGFFVRFAITLAGASASLALQIIVCVRTRSVGRGRSRLDGRLATIPARSPLVVTRAAVAALGASPALQPAARRLAGAVREASPSVPMALKSAATVPAQSVVAATRANRSARRAVPVGAPIKPRAPVLARGIQEISTPRSLVVAGGAPRGDALPLLEPKSEVPTPELAPSSPKRRPRLR